MPAYQQRVGRDFAWPKPWEGIGLDWYGDAREKYAPFAATAEQGAAAQDLIDTLSASPTIYWLRGAAERQLAHQYNIATHVARRLMRDCPGSATPQPNIWCAAAASAGWWPFKHKVYGALRADRLLTLDEVCEAVGGEPAASVFAALTVLVNQDRAAVCLQDAPDQALLYCRVRAGLDAADYSDLYRARMASAPQPGA